MKKALLILLLALLFTGCASPLVKRPAANNIEKIAFISVYSNSSIYDLEKSKKKTDTLSVLNKVVNGNDNIDDGNVQISTFALKHFSDNLSNSQWSIVPPSEVLKNEAYKAFVNEAKGDGVSGFVGKLASTQWAVPPNMAYIPYDAVVPKPGVHHFGDDPHGKAKERLAKLCKELGVDGVGIAYVDLAFERPFLSLRATGLLGAIKSSAIPQVSSEIVIVNSKGEIALQTPPVHRGGGERYEGKKVPMLRAGFVDFSGDEGQDVVASFSQAIEKNAKALKAAINKEMGKKG
jgi:hypothetical protein